MREFTAVVERCPDTKLYVGYVPGFPGAHSQGATLEELRENLREVVHIGSFVIPTGDRQQCLITGRASSRLSSCDRSSRTLG